jgi:hypothetical protein
MLLMAVVFVLLPAAAMLLAWLLAPRRPAGEDAPLLRFLFVFAGFLLGADAGFFGAGLIADSRGLGERAFGPVMLATLAVAALAAIAADALFVRRLSAPHA